jgi:hypothetical protein
MPEATDKCLCGHEKHEHEIEHTRYGFPIFGRCEAEECMCGRYSDAGLYYNPKTKGDGKTA